MFTVHTGDVHVQSTLNITLAAGASVPFPALERAINHTHANSCSTHTLTFHSTSSHSPKHIFKMNAVARRAAFAATRAPVRVTRRQASGTTSGAVPAEGRKQDASAVKKGAKKDPELYVRLPHL